MSRPCGEFVGAQVLVRDRPEVPKGWVGVPLEGVLAAGAVNRVLTIGVEAVPPASRSVMGGISIQSSDRYAPV